MAQSSHTFRVFVSSTFSDLKAERNALQDKVFPRLRELAVSHGCRFQAIDLRWGVSEEAALDQQTMKICLGEIERCQKTSPRPNFIVLLGDRYGWQPIPSEIHADEFEQIIPLVMKEEKNLLEQWYRRDDNAVPPVYPLQPRTGEFIEHERWELVETKLRQTFQSAIKKISLSSDAALKYTTSATEQEIVAGALNVLDANEHVFCFLRDIKGMPDDVSATSFRETEPEAARKQVALKKRLKKQLSGNVHEYTAQWQGDGPSQEHLDQLCEDVYAELSKVILAETGKLEKVDSLDAEITAHEAFGKDRARVFIGRADILKAIEKYISGSDPHPMAIWGASGSGKSALMAKAIEEAQKSGLDVLYRFIGATPESSNGRALLESLCKQISHRYGADESTIPSEYKDLVQEFPKRLALAKPDKPIMIFLDALDQLSDSDNARGLIWLPAELPPNVHLVASTLPGECLQVSEGKLPAQNRLEVQPMSVEDGKSILGKWFEDIRRRLQNKQEKHLLDKFKKCALPLYLKLAFEEAKLWKSYDDLPELSGDIPSILRDLFNRLSRESNHGQVLVSRSMGYLAAGKNGLSEDELLDVLSMDNEVLTDFQRRSPKSPKVERLPVVVWSRLYFDLEPYLTERSADGTSLLAFYHRQMSETVNAEYLSREDKPKRHQILARYFGKKPLQIEQETKKTPNLRKLSEQPYQQTHGELWGEVKITLTDFDFQELKNRFFSTYDLETDYQMAISFWNGNAEEKEVINAIEECLRLGAHHIRNAPELFFPHLYNHLIWHKSQEVHRIFTTAAIGRQNWLCMVQDPNPNPYPNLNILEEQTSPILTIAITPSGEKVVSGSSDGIVRIWDLTSGRLVRALEGHAGRVIDVAIAPDGQRVVSTSWDKTIKIWDLQLGCVQRSLREDTNITNVVVVTPDGHQIISGSTDGSINIWDLYTGSLLNSLGERSTGEATVAQMVAAPEAIAVSFDGHYAVSSSQGEVIKIWDLYTKRLLRSVENAGHPIAITPNGQRFISASRGGNIKIWGLQNGQQLHSIDDPDLLTWTSIAITPDGQQFISGCVEGTIKIWDLSNGHLLRTIEGSRMMSPGSIDGHTGEVSDIAVTPDGQKIVSGSGDKTIKIWDLHTGHLLQTLGVKPANVKTRNKHSDILHRSLEGHKKEVAAVAIINSSASAENGEEAGQIVLSGSSGSREETSIRVWNLRDGCFIHEFEEQSGITSIAVTPDSQRVITGALNNQTEIFDLHTGHRLQSLQETPTLNSRYDNRITSVVVTPDGQLIISGSSLWSDYGGEKNTNVIYIWDLATGSLINTLEGHTKYISAVAVTLDCQQIVSASWDKTIKIWNLKTGSLTRTIEGFSGLTALALTPDGKQVISGSVDSAINVWDLHGGNLLNTLPARYGEYVSALTVSPDGQQVIYCVDNLVRRWDIKSGECQALFANDATVLSLALSPDSCWLACGDKIGRVWIFEWIEPFII